MRFFGCQRSSHSRRTPLIIGGSPMERHFGYTLPPVNAQGLPQRSGETFTLETNPNPYGHTSLGKVAVHPPRIVTVFVRLGVCRTTVPRVGEGAHLAKCNRPVTGISDMAPLKTTPTRCTPRWFTYPVNRHGLFGLRGQPQGVSACEGFCSVRCYRKCQFCKPSEAAQPRAPSWMYL